ncbi:MAG: hypothetical protein Q8924_19895 [Bacillota bacterium]|nr:hypothetical protein [Bacillota bacterium]
MVHFWHEVIKNRADYVRATFYVDEVANVRMGPRARYGVTEVAVGRIGENSEELCDWREYLKKGQKKSELSGQRIIVMYNRNASDFNYSGKKLRVLSLTQFMNAETSLVWDVVVVGIAPVAWFFFFYWCKKNAL